MAAGPRVTGGALPAPLLLLLAALLWAAPARAYAELSDDALRHIPGAAADLDARTGTLLAPLLIPRAPGTPGSEAVKRHLAGFFEAEKYRGGEDDEDDEEVEEEEGKEKGGEAPADWAVEWHNFTARTPTPEGGHADVRFGNLIMTRDPPWAAGRGGGGDVGRLTLVAHHDSLARPEGFVGAVDSAVPCAILLQAARAVDGALGRKWEAEREEGEQGLEQARGLQILFLDGEEAFVRWTDTDSIYGARALADKWEGEEQQQGAGTSSSSSRRGPLEAIDLFVLLDLLGSPGPRVPSYFEATHWAYQRMARVEARMRGLGLLRTTNAAASGNEGPGSERREEAAVFLPDSDKRPGEFSPAYVLDDHVPFLQRGVPVLHVVPTPFPAVWHTLADDGAHLDPAAVEDWAKIVTAFVAEWMELGDYMLPPTPGQPQHLHPRVEKTEL